MNTTPSTTTILFIDGDDESRRHFAHRLKLCWPDSIIVETKNGESALMLYQTEKFDCVILEIALPDMSGFEVFAKLVSVARQRRIAVVVLSRLFSPALSEVVMRHGAFAYMDKKRVSGDELVKVITKAIAAVRSTNKEPHSRPL
jgi:DNA-binding NarL/FixJ family response regulator